MSNPATEFHSFSQLPSELRLAIWHYAIPNPRVILLACQRESKPRGTSTRRYVKAFTSSTPAPPLLHACHESRVEVLRTTYSPMFRTLTSPIYTYISFPHDTVHCKENVLQYLGGTELVSIRSMVVDVQDIAYFGHYHLGILVSMKALRLLNIVARGKMELPWGNRRYVDNLIRDIEDAWKAEPTWNAPCITITDSEMGERLWSFDGGFAPPPHDDDE